MIRNLYARFLFAVLVLSAWSGVRAQSPGGVAPAAWYRAGSGVFSDAGTTPAADNATMQQWNSQIGSFPLLQGTAGWRPTFSNATTLANFNPTVTFNGSHFMQFTPGAGVNIIDRATGSIFAAGFMNTVTGCGIAGFDESMDFPGLHTSTSNPRKLLFFASGGPDYTGVNSDPFIAGRYFAIGSGWENSETPGSYLGATVSFDGERVTYLPADNKTYNVNTGDAYRDFRIGWDNNWGAFNGQLNEVMVYEERLSESQMDRVETYMAIKYGTTYAAGTRNYVNSAGNPVWTAADNAGFHHNIAGIARDDNGALHQKQSWSTNPGQQVLISTSGLANTNAENEVGLGDGSFLLWGDNGLTKSPSVAVSGLSGINYHFAAIWKVQNNTVGTVRVAWPKGMNNLSLIQSSDATIGGGDVVTLMTANEITVNGVDYNYAFVSLANGTYFTFGGSLYVPGGIVPAAWYRADSKVYSDAGVTPAADATGVAQWNEYNGFGFDLKQATQANRPVFSNSTTLSNFNPTITFTGANGTRLDYLVADKGEIIDRNTGTLFSAGKTAANAGLFGFGANMDFPGIYITGGNNLTFLGSFGGNWATDVNTPPNAQGNFIGGGGWLNGASPLSTPPSISRNLIATSYNGRYFSHDALNTWDTDVTGSDGNLSVGHDPNFAHLTGQQNEMIVFDTKLTDEQMNRVESYLAIKWGQTLSKASSRNYLDAGGNIIWNGTANQTHYHNVFGLGRQDVAAFDQRVAKSVNADAIMTVAADNDFALPNHDVSRRDFAGNETYFLLGDNNNVTTTLADITAGSLELKRIPKDWHSQRTSSAGTLYFSTDLSGYGANFSGSNPVYMLIADDAAFTTNVRTVSATLVAGEWVSSYGFDAQPANQYITYGFTPPTCSAGNGIAPGGVTNGLSYWYRADNGTNTTTDGADVTAWQDAWSHTTSGQIGSAALPKYKTGTVDYFNFNAGVNFTASNQVIGNTSVQTLFNTDFDIFTFTKNEVNGRFFNVGVNNTLLGGNNWDQPAFMGDGAIARRANAAGSYGSIGYVNPGGGHSGIGYHRFNDVEFTKAMNGAATATPFTHTGRGQMEGGHLFGSNAIAPWNGDDVGFRGHIGETIVYGCGNLSEIERRRVDTYLAVKYGFTLDRTETDHYLAADESIVWDGGTNTAFNNNIFGVAREDIGGFAQKASKSVNSGTIMTIATTGDFVNPNDDAARRDFDNDKTYFILGDNANTATPTVAVTGMTGLERIQRVWLSQRTDDAGDLHFSADLSAYGTNFGGSKNVYMIIADDEDLTVNVRTVQATLVNGEWVTDYDFDEDETNQYITYGYKEPPYELGCNENQMFYSHGAGNTTLEDVNYSGSPLTATAIGTAGIRYNAAGYNSVDGYIYAISSNYHLVRVNNIGAATVLGTVSGLPANFEYNSGDFIPGTGMLYVTQNQTNKMYVIDVANVTVDHVIDLTSNAAVSDIAWDATTAKFYGVNNTSGALMSIDPVTGTVATIGGSGGGVFGAMMGACNGIYGISNAGGFYRFDLVSGARTKLAETTGIAPGGSGFDGAHCHSNCIDDDALPVSLLHFNGYQESSAVMLNWATVNEHDNAGFDVERSADGRSWDRVGFISGKAANGTSETRLDYSFTDATPLAGKNYYRLKQIDISGSFEYSRLVLVDIRSGKSSLLVYPNPVAGGKLTLELAESEIRSVGVFSITGTRMRVGKLQSDNTLEIGNLPAGQYFVRVTGKNGEVITKSFIVN